MNYAIVWDVSGSIEHFDTLDEAIREAYLVGEQCSIFESENNELGTCVYVHPE